MRDCHREVTSWIVVKTPWNGMVDVDAGRKFGRGFIRRLAPGGARGILVGSASGYGLPNPAAFDGDYWGQCCQRVG